MYIKLLFDKKIIYKLNTNIYLVIIIIILICNIYLNNILFKYINGEAIIVMTNS